MIIRSAVLEGTVPEAHRAAFDQHMHTSVLAAIATYPGITDVKLRRQAETEPGAPPIHMIFDLYFPDLATMQAALASETRQQVRAKIAEAMPMFQGRVYHLIMQQD